MPVTFNVLYADEGSLVHVACYVMMMMMMMMMTMMTLCPPVTFNVLYADEATLVHVACYVDQRADGTCPRDKTELTVLGRTRTLTPDTEGRLGALMASVCLERDHLVPTRDTGEQRADSVCVGGSWPPSASRETVSNPVRSTRKT